MVRYERMSPRGTPALLSFFDRPDQGFCFCRFWSFDGDVDAWLAADPESNRRLCERDAAAGALDGILAWDGDRVVGWLRLSRTEDIPKLARQELEEDVAPTTVSILCMAVAEEHRGKGVAAGMLDAALAVVEADGVREVHAYPRPEDALDAGAVWTGPMKLYRSRGFTIVSEGGRRATVRRVLPSAAGES